MNLNCIIKNHLNTTNPLLTNSGTGKSYAAAFAMRELGFKKVLVVVHRNQIASQLRQSFKNVLGSSLNTGLVSGTAGSDKDYTADYVFATVQTLSRDANLGRFAKDNFECCIYDECHHTIAGTYQKIMIKFRKNFITWGR